MVSPAITGRVRGARVSTVSSASWLPRAVLCVLTAWSTSFGAGYTVTSPTEGDTLNVGVSHHIAWTTDSTGGGSYVTLQLYRGTEYDRTIISSRYDYGYYDWSLPAGLDTSAAYRVKVMSSADPYLFGYSGDFSVLDESGITITSPDSTDTLTCGSSSTVRWTTTGQVGSYLRLELYRGTQLVQTLYSSIYATNSSYTWTVPLDLDTTAAHRLKLTSTYYPSIYAYSDEFYVTDRWSITFSSPDTGDTVVAGQYTPIQWQAEGVGSYVRLELYSGTSYVQSIYSSTSNDGYYSWSPYTSTTGGDDYRIRLSSTSSTSRYAYSPTFTIVPYPQLTVASPSSGDMHYLGSTLTVEWTSQGAVGDNVRVDLYRSSSLVGTLALTTPNDGSLDWTVAGDLTESAYYRIRVSATGASSPYDYSDYFYVGPSDSAVVTSPAAGDTLVPGQTLTIQWRTAPITYSYVYLYLYLGDSWVSTFGSSTYNDGSQTYTLPGSLPTSSDYRIRLSHTYNGGQVFESDPFTIDATPRLTISSPVDSTVIEAGKPVQLYWTSTGSVSSLTLSYAEVGSSQWTTVNADVANTGSYSWTTPALQATRDVRVKLQNRLDSIPYDIVPITLAVRPELIGVASPSFDATPRLSWHPSAPGETYSLTVSQSPSMVSPVLVAPVGDTSFVPLVPLPSGTLYWQVTAVSLPTFPSAVDSFSVLAAGVPVLVPVSPDPTTDRTPSLRWHRVTGASLYHVVVATAPTFVSPLLAVPVVDTAYHVGYELPYGPIYWRVKSNMSDDYAPSDMFRVVPDTIPILHAYDGDTLLQTRPRFSWRPVSRASSYRIEVYDLPGKSAGMPFISLGVADTSHVPFAPLSYGTMYYWRVSCSLDPSVYSDWDSLFVGDMVFAVPVRQAPLRTGLSLRAAGRSVELSCATTTGQPITIELYRPSGALLMQETWRPDGPGYHAHVLDRGCHAPGAVIARVHIDGAVLTRRVQTLW